MNNRRDPYTRPNTFRPVAISILTLRTVALLIGGIFVPRIALAPAEGDAEQVRTDNAEALTEGCQVIQQLSYARCGHQLTRRQTLPQELVGKSRPEAEAAYEQYRITSYASDELRMEQTLDMFCADHLVLQADETGMLAVFENKYGDALALVQETDILLSTLPASYQEELLPGKPFDTLEEAERWLESIES